MRHLGWLVVIAGAALAQSPDGGNANKADISTKVVSVFGPGEQTVYEVSYMGISAGRAEITVGWKMEQFGQEVWPLVCVGETTDVAAIFPVKDRFVSYWDPLARKSLGADYFAHEGKYRAKERFVYDRDSSEAVVTKEAPGWPTTTRRYPIEQGTIDLAAAGFHFRNTKLVTGEVHHLSVFTGVKVYKMKATVVGREVLRTSMGEIEVYRVTFNGEFDGKLAAQGLMTIFYSTDDKQLPVRAEAKLALGHVKIEAVKYEAGRRYTGAE